MLTNEYIYMMHFVAASQGNAIFSPILLQACIYDFPDVVRTILSSGVIEPNNFLTFKMLVDLFNVSHHLLSLKSKHCILMFKYFKILLNKKYALIIILNTFKKYLWILNTYLYRLELINDLWCAFGEKIY